MLSLDQPINAVHIYSKFFSFSRISYFNGLNLSKLFFLVHFGVNKRGFNFRLINTLLWLLVPLFFSISFASNSQTLSNIQPLFGEHGDLVLASQRDASGNTYVSVALGGYGDEKLNVHDSLLSNNSGYSGEQLCSLPG
jgi:hypothetical protein